MRLNPPARAYEIDIVTGAQGARDRQRRHQRSPVNLLASDAGAGERGTLPLAQSSLGPG